MNLKKWILLAASVTLFLNCFGQKSLTYQVLVADKAYAQSRMIYQFEQLLPGDTIEIKSRGYLAVVSSQFHPLEVAGDTTFVLPNYELEEIGNAFIRPDLEKLFSNIRLNNSYGTNAVEHAMYFMDLLYPLKASHIISSSDKLIPVIWKDYRSNKEKEEEEASVKITDMFANTITAFELDEGFICLNLNQYPKAIEAFNRDSLIIIDFYQPNMNGRQFAVKLTANTNWQHPFEINECRVDSPTLAVAIGMFLEYNRGTYSDIISSYYELATLLSSVPVYRTIYEQFKIRSISK